MFGRSKRTCKDAVPIVAAIAVLACQWGVRPVWVSTAPFAPSSPAAESWPHEASVQVRLWPSIPERDTPDAGSLRVVAGPFDSRDEAQTGATRVREAG